MLHPPPNNTSLNQHRSRWIGCGAPTGTYLDIVNIAEILFGVRLSIPCGVRIPPDGEHIESCHSGITARFKVGYLCKAALIDIIEIAMKLAALSTWRRIHFHAHFELMPSSVAIGILPGRACQLSVFIKKIRFMAVKGPADFVTGVAPDRDFVPVDGAGNLLDIVEHKPEVEGPSVVTLLVLTTEVPVVPSMTLGL